MVARKALSRKQRFKAAVAVAGITAKAWCEEQGVTEQHLYACLRGERDSDRLMAAVDAFIAEQQQVAVNAA